jgi:putative transposase
MPRTARAIIANQCYHIINRGNKKGPVFHERADFEQFLALLTRAQQRLRLPILAACLMPNHIHLVVRPTRDADLARWTHWVFTTHVRWTVMRYVERNALRAKLVERAEDWEWGSLAWRRLSPAPVELAASPVQISSYWRHLVNEPQTAAEIAEIRTCVNRQRPFGDADWVANRAIDLGLEQSLAPKGRPRKSRRVPVC